MRVVYQCMYKFHCANFPETSPRQKCATYLGPTVSRGSFGEVTDVSRKIAQRNLAFILRAIIQILITSKSLRGGGVVGTKM